jgi:hypothetical protein
MILQLVGKAANIATAIFDTIRNEHDDPWSSEVLQDISGSAHSARQRCPAKRLDLFERGNNLRSATLYRIDAHSDSAARSCFVAAKRDEPGWSVFGDVGKYIGHSNAGEFNLCDPNGGLSHRGGRIKHNHRVLAARPRQVGNQTH